MNNEDDIIIEYQTEDGRTRYEAGRLSSYGGNTLTLELIHGRHEFSRIDGRWIAGDCLNYRLARVRDEHMTAPRVRPESEDCSGYTWTLGVPFATHENSTVPLSC